jgi:hypothetical protein
VTPHERYGTLYGHLGDRNKEMAQTFGFPARSNAVLCLMLMHRHGLLTEEEVRDFSADVQRSLEEVPND